MIYGIGIDLVENDRIEKIIRKWGPKFLSRVFTGAEIEYCGRHAQSPFITARGLPSRNRFSRRSARASARA